jgi:8-oxo-dGTP pyrophosphatase MutT (NUDIX family)
MRPLVSDEEVRTLCQKGYGPGRAWALREAEERGISKDFSAGSPLASGFVPFDLEPGVRSVVPELKKPKKKKPKKTKAQSAPDAAAPPGVIAAGLAVRAEDTGRVLMLQRSVDPDDPASGQIEFGGGRLEAGETPFGAACREWSEEVGCPCPSGQVVGMWQSSDGKYEGFVLSVPHESAVPINLDYPRVDNPDNLHAKPETAIWMAIGDIHGLPSLRSELARDLPRVLPALHAPVRSSKAADPPSGPRMMGTSIPEDEVMEYLQKHYPDSDLGWVSRCLWVKDNVLLENIDYQDRPGGIEKDKVEDMADKLDEGWDPHPVVLVAPDADSEMYVADGYHRLNALDEAGADVATAWIGLPKPGGDGWKADVEQMQRTVTNHPGNQ